MLTADDCSKTVNFVSEQTLTCSTKFADEDLEISINIKTCRAKPSVTLGIKVDALDLDWSETFENSVEIPIPRLAFPVGGVNLRVIIHGKSNGGVYLKVYSRSVVLKYFESAEYTLLNIHTKVVFIFCSINYFLR